MENEVEEREIVAGGVESVRGMHRLCAQVNIILRLLTTSWAELPAGRLRISCLHLQKPLCALGKTVPHLPWLTRSRSQGEAYTYSRTESTEWQQWDWKAQKEMKGRVRQLEWQGDSEWRGWNQHPNDRGGNPQQTLGGTDGADTCRIKLQMLRLW